MSEITLYAKDRKLATNSGAILKPDLRPTVQWREQVTFTVRLASGTFTAGSYHYAFDVDRDFLNTAPCNTGTCTLDNGALTFMVTFDSVTMAKATNGRRYALPFYIQITRDGSDHADYILDDAIWADGCVWDGRTPPAPEAAAYYTRTEVDAIADRKLNAPDEPGETGYVLSLAEDGSTAWIRQSGGGGSTSWDDITGKPDFARVATTGSYNDLTNKPTIPAAQQQADWNEADDTKADYIKNKPALKTVATTGSYDDLTNKPTIPAAQQQADWNEADDTKADFIKNKPSLATVATTGSYSDLTNKPSIPTSSDYIPQSEKGAANGIPTLNASQKIPDTQLPDGKPITTISASSSTYTLSDGCFEHTPSAAAPTYTLPAVTDATRTHWIILTVKFSSTQTIAFEDAGGATIVPLDTLTIAANDVVEYLCQYDALQSKWVIACGKLNS